MPARERSAVDFGRARSSVRLKRHFEAEEGHMAKYLILIYGPESDAPASPEQCPAPGGGVEVRPIMDTSGGPPSA